MSITSCKYQTLFNFDRQKPCSQKRLLFASPHSLDHRILNSPCRMRIGIAFGKLSDFCFMFHKIKSDHTPVTVMVCEIFVGRSGDLLIFSRYGFLPESNTMQGAKLDQL